MIVAGKLRDTEPAIDTHLVKLNSTDAKKRYSRPSPRAVLGAVQKMKESV